MYFGVVNAQKSLIAVEEEYIQAVKDCVVLNKSANKDFECHVVKGLKNIIHECKCSERQVKALAE